MEENKVCADTPTNGSVYFRDVQPKIPLVR